MPPWDSPGKNTGVGCHFPSPGHLPNPEFEPGSPAFQADALTSEPPVTPTSKCVYLKQNLCVCCIYLFGLCWVLVAACRIFTASSFVAVHGLSSCGMWALERVALQPMGLAVVVHMGPASLQHVGSQFLNQGSNWRPLHCKANS